MLELGEHTNLNFATVHCVIVPFIELHRNDRTILNTQAFLGEIG